MTRPSREQASTCCVEAGVAGALTVLDSLRPHCACISPRGSRGRARVAFRDSRFMYPMNLMVISSGHTAPHSA